MNCQFEYCIEFSMSCPRPVGMSSLPMIILNIACEWDQRGFPQGKLWKSTKRNPSEIGDFFGALFDKHLAPKLTGKSAGKDSICGIQKPNKHNLRHKNNHIINALMQIKIKQSPTETCANFSNFNQTIYFSILLSTYLFIYANKYRCGRAHIIVSYNRFAGLFPSVSFSYFSVLFILPN